MLDHIARLWNYLGFTLVEHNIELSVCRRNKSAGHSGRGAEAGRAF